MHDRNGRQFALEDEFEGPNTSKVKDKTSIVISGCERTYILSEMLLVMIPFSLLQMSGMTLSTTLIL